MSDSKLPVVQATDMTEEDQDRLNKFVAIGAPGFNLADEGKISRLLDLYLGGKTYRQISRINRIPKELVMLYSQRLKWYDLKVEYLKELELQLHGRVVEAKVASQDFLLQLSQMYQKKIAVKMDKYFQTGDEVEADKIDLKEIDKYLKIVDAIQTLASNPSSRGSKPTVGINVGDGFTMVKKGDNEVEITPKQKAFGSMLEQLANERRETELAKITKSNDIKDVKPKGEGENDDKK